MNNNKSDNLPIEIVKLIQKGKKPKNISSLKKELKNKSYSEFEINFALNIILENEMIIFRGLHEYVDLQPKIRLIMEKYPDINFSQLEAYWDDPEFEVDI